MYRTITFRSRKLKTEIIAEDLNGSIRFLSQDELMYNPLNEDEISRDPDQESEGKAGKLTSRDLEEDNEVRRKMQEELFQDESNNKGDYDEDDYDPDELEDINADKLLNADGFYNPLEPVDSGEVRKKTTVDKKLLLAIAGGGIGFLAAVIYMLSTFGLI